MRAVQELEPRFPRVSDSETANALYLVGQPSSISTRDAETASLLPGDRAYLSLRQRRDSEELLNRDAGPETALGRTGAAEIAFAGPN